MGNTYLSGYDAAGNPVYATAETPTDAEMALDQATQNGLNLSALQQAGGNSLLPGLSGTSGNTNTSAQPTTGILGSVQSFFNWINSVDPTNGMNLQGTTNPVTVGASAGAATSSAVSSTASAAASGLSFITNIPRVATTLLGLILIIAGIFALSRGPAVNIVTSAVKDAVTS